MGVLKKVAKAGFFGTEQGANYMLGHSIASNAVTNIIGSGDDLNVLQEFLGFAWKCIMVRAESLAAEQIFVEQSKNGKWEMEPQHEFNKLLAGDEDQYDLYELMIAHQVSLDLYGESFWYFSKGDQTGRPMGRYLLDPNWVTVYVANGRVTGYVYRKNNENIVLDVEEVAHYRIYDPNPWREYRGLGPMLAAGWFVKSNRYVSQYVNSFLENNAVPAGVIVAKSQVNNEDWELFKEQWTTRYSGASNAGKTGFVRGSDLDFVKTGLSLGEADFSKIKTVSRDEVMTMFGISGPMMGIYENSNRASATTAKGLFATTFTEPALTRLCSKLTRKMQNFYGPNYRIGHTNPIPEDVDQQLALYQAGTNKWITVNEARQQYGLDALPNGDTLYVENTLNPLGAKPAQPPAAKTLGKLTIRTKSRDFSYEMKESFRSETEALQRKYELKFLEAANPVLEEQLKMVLGQLKPKKAVNTNFDTTTESQKLANAVEEIMIAMAIEQGNIALAFVTSADNKFELTSVQQNYIKDSIAKACAGFTQDTQEKISKALADGLEAGESLTQISTTIKGIYDDVLGTDTPGYRIERLSRTEVIKASNEITQAAYAESGVVEQKEWFANPGACEYCASLDGAVISLSMAFVAQGGTIDGVDGGTRVNDYETIEHPPAHPSCRCTIVPVIEK